MDGDNSESLAVARRVDARCDVFELALATGTSPLIESFLTDVLASERQTLLLELLGLELDFRVARGEQPTVGDYANRFPELSAEQLLTRFADISDTQRNKLSEEAAYTATVDMSVGTELSRTGGENSGQPAGITEIYHPDPKLGDQRLGRYRLLRLLGEGAFGRVWLGQDSELQRYVAIKVPTPERFQKPEDAEAYLAEARMVAGLDHPHIVPVHDVGRADDGSIYVVSKFIAGCTLKDRMTDDAPTFEESARLLAIIAQALNHAHQKRLIHRDVKPANILLEDATGKPYVADFGMAIREEDDLQNGKIAGTPAYMSPEQARGEGHRLDGRSDIFSLGVIFYELLTGKRPFRGSTALEMLHQVISADPVPPRELLDSIPLEMERICLKALSKRASERYSTAEELADDLLHWQLGAQEDQNEQRIVPRGLRSFDADDADFFLDLLPGPRDRDGLPESIRFWKTRLEETDPDQTFSVGLIYGPSGCGKSSLVKAGLLPRLAKTVVAIYVEATPDDTETRILRGLRKQLPDLPDQLGLVETFTLLRRGTGPKVVIVLDQFEQCLHAQRTEQDTALVNALRQCNGGRLQAVVMVRDDFAMAAARFMDSLDIRMVQGHNFATVDLFDVDHARKVLIKFGQAFGKLPTQVSALSEPEREFVSSVATGLADDGQVVSVRLALFAEMIKSKPWMPATLEEVGGTAGVGVTFLEETFASRSANPNHRLHQPAAREVLKLLLPEVGTDIKGHMRSQAELMEAAGYQHRPDDFHDLLRILDGELRLITPTDPEGFQTESGGDASSKYYQFAHDYLVPSLREWLTRKQKETPRGRAELLLDDRAGVWNARPENRQLPSLAQWFQIKWFTEKKSWTPQQRKMMVKAGRHHAIRSVVVALLLAVVTFTGLTIRQQGIVQRNATHADGLIDSLLKADIAQVPAVVSDLNDYREWSDPLLRAKLAEATDGSEAKLHLALALLPVDDRQIEYLREQLPVCTLEQLPVVRKALLPHKAKLTEALWQVVQDESQDAPHRFQTAAALSEYAPNDERWKSAAPFVAQHLTSVVSSAYLGSWRQLFQPASKPLTSPLTGIQADRSRSEKQREAAVFLLSDYLRDQPEQLVEVILVADELAEFSQLIAALKPHSAAVRQRLLNETQAAMPVHLAKTNDQLSEVDQQLRDAHWKRQSLAAVTLMHLGSGDEVWSLLKFTPDPSLRSFIIHHFGKLGTDHNVLAARLELESEVSVRRALIQSLGGLDSTRIPQADRSRIAERLQAMYVNDFDPGIHGSASWTLRKWGVALSELPVGERDLAATSPSVGETALSTARRNDIRRWYVNGQGQTMVVIPYHDEIGESAVTHRFAISSHEVTVAEFRRFREKHVIERTIVPTDDCPVHAVSWFDAAEYCNWLSQTEGISEDQWIYEPNGQGKYAEGMKIKENSRDLTGYRIPTDAEWELACRTGAIGSYGFGEPLALLKHYGWHGANSIGSTHPVESLLPNDFGLFDLHGHLYEWTQFPTSGEMSRVKNNTSHALRGGSFDTPSSLARSANRILHAPFTQFFFNGFRIAKSFPRFSASEVSHATEDWKGWPAEAPPPAIAPFDAEQAQQYQEVWAKYLGLPVTYTNTIGMKFRLIPPGEFTMGSTLEEIEESLKDVGENRHWHERIKSEAPQHKVILTHPIYLGVHEVTQADYERVMGKNPSYFASTGPDKQFVERVAGMDTTRHPVERVSWNDTAEFCAKLSEKEKLKPFYVRAGETVTPLNGTGYRLPSEAEWEYACRAGTTTKYWIGDQAEELNRTGWFRTTSSGRTHSVGESMENAFGLYDVHGNVWEWVQDGWEPTYYGQFQEMAAFNPVAPYSASLQRVRRGGDWGRSATYCRTSFRYADNPTWQANDIGFRVSLGADAVRQALKVARSMSTKSSVTTPADPPVWDGWLADDPRPATAPFDAEQAKHHQENWAKHLKLPVEYTNSLGMKFRLIPPGEFTMGSTPKEIEEALKRAGQDKHWQDGIKSEAPQHKVILTQPVYVGVHEVTQAEYEKVMGRNPSHFAPLGAGKEAVAGLETASHPVETVSWDDAAEFCTKLSEREKLKPFSFELRTGEIVTIKGTGYRLPTEAEWEFACRAGTMSKYWSGDMDEDLMRAGWFVANSGGRTHAAGELSANPFGLFDLHGSVWEWVQDVWEPTYYGQQQGNLTLDPIGPSSVGSQRVMRGGSWYHTASPCQSSHRDARNPTTHRVNRNGFRVVLPVNAVKATRK